MHSKYSIYPIHFLLLYFSWNRFGIWFLVASCVDLITFFSLIFFVLYVWTFQLCYLYLLYVLQTIPNMPFFPLTQKSCVSLYFYRCKYFHTYSNIYYLQFFLYVCVPHRYDHDHYVSQCCSGSGSYDLSFYPFISPFCANKYSVPNSA